jgi:hypothetical protein
VAPDADLGIGVTHTPARRLLQAFAQDGHALVLAGHTHGGQLRVPGLGAVLTNCDLERSRARGLSPLTPAGGGVAARERRAGRVALPARALRLPPGGDRAGAGRAALTASVR